MGTIVNVSNVASLITGFVSLSSIGCRRVYAGLSKAWLWRRASKGQGVTVRRWRAATSGGSLTALRKTPFMAGGIILATVMASGFTASAFTGILVPTLKIRTINGWMAEIPGYAGNAGIGDLLDCMNTTEGRVCAPGLALGAVGLAMFNSAGSNSDPSYTFGSLSVFPGPSHTAGMVGFLDGFAGFSIWTPGHIPVDAVEYTSVGLQIDAKCTQIYDVGVNLNTGAFYYDSYCQGAKVQFGDANKHYATYSTANGCIGNGGDYTVEYAVAGAQVVYETRTVTPLSFSCTIQATEGIVTSHNDAVAWTASFDDEHFVPGQRLTGEEVRTFASAIVAAVLQDGAVYGKTGPLSTALPDVLRLNGSAALDMTLAEGVIANGAAAAATAGYFILLPSTQDGPLDDYTTLHPGNYTYAFTSYGWANHKSMFVWGVVSAILGLCWLAAVFYMAKGGTAYDPTDWFQTMNTGAGSQLAQIPGTCTGVGLQGKDIENTLMWYGEIGPTHIGFSNHPAVAVHPAKRYGIDARQLRS